MPSTRRQKAKARKSRELDMLSDYDNMDVMLGDGNSNSIERELDSLINVPDGRRDYGPFPNRENSSQENEIRDINNQNEPVREERLVESINTLSSEMNARMSREMETMMDFMQNQISRAINCAISERIIPEIQNMVGNLPLNQHGVEPPTSFDENRTGNMWKNTNEKITKKDSRSACDLRDHTDFTPYTIRAFLRRKIERNLTVTKSNRSENEFENCISRFPEVNSINCKSSRLIDFKSTPSIRQKLFSLYPKSVRYKQNSFLWKIEQKKQKVLVQYDLKRYKPSTLIRFKFQPSF